MFSNLISNWKRRIKKRIFTKFESSHQQLATIKNLKKNWILNVEMNSRHESIFQVLNLKKLIVETCKTWYYLLKVLPKMDFDELQFPLGIRNSHVKTFSKNRLEKHVKFIYSWSEHLLQTPFKCLVAPTERNNPAEGGSRKAEVDAGFRSITGFGSIDDLLVGSSNLTQWTDVNRFNKNPFNVNLKSTPFHSTWFHSVQFNFIQFVC